MQAREVLKIFRQRSEIGRLALISEFMKQSGLELIDNFRELITTPYFGVLVKKTSEFFQHFKIIDDLFANARPLHFDNHRPAIAQARGMHLA
jgi:hypothetical protein